MNRMIHPLALLLLLSGCGTMPEERAVSGAGIGAGAGAIIGAVTGLTVLEAAALGAAAGGLTGVLTDSDKVNFGQPAWKRGTTASSAAPAPTAYRDPHVASIQRELNGLGYDAGPVDGRMGPRTRAAIRAFQSDNGLLADGVASPELADRLRSHGS